uniref:AAA domain-containing protein n=1 Tax=Strongyloides stercoralis TaxID=6248 RepID=A0A0K0E4C6_STRER
MISRVNYFLRFSNLKNYNFVIRNLSSKKKKLIKPKDTSIPALFKQKLDSAKKLLKDEIDFVEKPSVKDIGDSSKERNDEEFTNRKVKVSNAIFDSIHGKVVEVFNEEFIGKNNNKLKLGYPFVLKIYDFNIDTVVLKFDPVFGKLRLKIIDKNVDWNIIRKNEECKLLPSNRNTLTNVLKFISDTNFFTLPGWNTMKCIYGGEGVPVAYSDRGLKFTQSLNASQQNAVKASLNSKRNIVCISGPPGTGKTQVISEIIRQLQKKKKKILIVGPRKDVLTNILKYFDSSNLNGCCMFDEDKHSFDSKLKSHRKFDDLHLVSNVINDIKNNNDASTDMSKFFKIAQDLSITMKLNIIRSSKIIYTTTGRNIMGLLATADFIPDVVLFDEASQILEPVSWRYLLNGQRSIVVGDPNQLTTSLNSENKTDNPMLQTSIVEYLWKNLPTSCKVLLNCQYRTNEKIIKWSSKTFYNNEMYADDSNKNIVLSDISGIDKKSRFNHPVVVFDSKDCRKFYESRLNTSYINYNEASVCVKYIKFLLKNGIKKRDIGVITPYSAQRQELEKHLEDVKVSTVDGFQGQEKEVIVFCFVRNNRYKEIGFLSNEKRMNVALTRSRRQFVFIGNTDMLSCTESFKELRDCLVSAGPTINADKYLLETES